MSEVNFVDDSWLPELPKWSQMRVSGKTIEKSQAMEIIRRTDRCFSSYGIGNDRGLYSAIAKSVGMPYSWYWNPLPHDQMMSSIDQEDREKWAADWGYIDGLEYVRNDWLTSCFIFGNNGWCHPDGTIRYTHNVGKYPSVLEIANEWKILLDAFPFLDLSVTLMSGEESEDSIYPLASMDVFDGKVRITNDHDGIRNRFTQEESDVKSFDLFKLFKSGPAIDLDEIDTMWGTPFREKHPEYFVNGPLGIKLER